MVLPYHEEREHGLCNVEAVAPVVICYLSVAFADGVHKPHQNLQIGREGVSLCDDS